MKVGTDGLLLGAWANIESSTKILDVGTGTGLIALMCAQRNSFAKIHAIDLDELAVCQATSNVNNSHFAKNISVWHADYRTFVGMDIEGKCKYDHIVSNPPYFSEKVLSPDLQRCMARNMLSLPFDDLLENSASLLEEEGKLSVILPKSMSYSMISQAIKYNLFLSRRTDIADSPRAEYKRTLLEFVNNIIYPTKRSCFTIRNHEGEYSDEYRRLTCHYLRW